MSPFPSPPFQAEVNRMSHNQEPGAQEQAPTAGAQPSHQGVPKVVRFWGVLILTVYGVLFLLFALGLVVGVAGHFLYSNPGPSLASVLTGVWWTVNCFACALVGEGLQKGKRLAIRGLYFVGLTTLIFGYIMIFPTIIPAGCPLWVPNNLPAALVLVHAIALALCVPPLLSAYRHWDRFV